jgi:hypothetical protein
LAALDQVTVTLCDAAHWGRIGKSRPRRHQVRQVANASDAYRHSQADWLIHMDADEFLWADGLIAAQLALVDADADALIVPVAERVHLPGDPGRSVFEGAFRRPFQAPPKTGRAVFGRGYYMTYRGLTGHVQGKSFLRTRRDIAPMIHRPRAIVGGVEPVTVRADCACLELLHFDGLTAAQWTFKLARMLHALEKRDGMPPPRHRGRQAEAILTGDEDPASLYHRLKYADTAMQVLMQAHQIWSARAFDPRPALAQWFPECANDLHPDTIDTWLEDRKSHIRRFLDAKRGI